jgi:uncharacterized damage-inducible protein DinB
MKIKSNVLLDQLSQVTESHIRKAIDDYQNMLDEQLLQPAEDGGWSIAQCLDHLNGYGMFYFPLMQNGMEQRVTANPDYNSTWLGDQFTKSLHPDTGKMKMKAFKAHRPPRELNAKAVVAEFIRQQEDLLAMMKLARQRDLTSIKIPTSISRWIRMNLGDTFRFIVAHNERHMRQAGRILTQVMP